CPRRSRGIESPRHEVESMILGLASLLLLQAPAPSPSAGPSPPAGEADKAKEKKEKEEEEKPTVTKQELKIGGRGLKYTVTTGLLPLKDKAGETEARIFFMAYVADRTGGPEARPLTFSFNGGPGSSSVWLHLGALGPKRVAMQPDGAMPQPPYKLVDNDSTWLDTTDLVFIDPVGTGYSRPGKPDLWKKFWGVQGAIESVGEFIRLSLPP